MKKILFVAIFVVAFKSDILHAQTAVASSIDSWIPDNYIEPFIKKGELRCQGGAFLSGKVTLYFYRAPKDQSWMILNGNLGAVNILLKEELDSSSSATQFLNQYIFLWLISTMGGDEWNLNKELLDTYVKEYEKVSFGPILQKCSSDKGPTYTDSGKKWKIQFYTMTIRGGVELWLAEGNTFPLQISSYKKTMILPNGTIQLGPAIR